MMTLYNITDQKGLGPTYCLSVPPKKWDCYCPFNKPDKAYKIISSSAEVYYADYAPIFLGWLNNKISSHFDKDPKEKTWVVYVYTAIGAFTLVALISLRAVYVRGIRRRTDYTIIGTAPPPNAPPSAAEMVSSFP